MQCEIKKEYLNRQCNWVTCPLPNINALKNNNKMIPWFNSSTQEHSIEELNEQVILVNLWVVTFKYIKNRGDILSTMEVIKEMVQN